MTDIAKTIDTAGQAVHDATGVLRAQRVTIAAQQARIDAALAECARLREECQSLHAKKCWCRDCAKRDAADRIERALKGDDDE